MTAAAFIAKTSGYSSSNTTSNSVALPAGIAAGDLALFFVWQFGNSGSYNPNYSGSLSAWTSYTYFSSSTARADLYTKVVTAADVSGGSISFACYAYSSFAVLAYRGSSIAVDAKTSNAATGTGSTVLPSVTTTKGGDVLVAGIVEQTNWSSGGAAFGTPSGWTSRANLASGSGAALGVIERSAATGGAGSYGGDTVTPSNGSDHAAVLIAISTNSAPIAPTWGAATPADGSSVSRATAQTLAFVHSDPDGDAQVGYDIQARVAGTTNWTTYVSAPTGTAISYSVAANTLGGKVEFQVRTYDTAGPGAWSVSRTLNFQDAAGAASSSPTHLDPLALLALHAGLKAQDAVTALATSGPSGVGVLKAQGTYAGSGAVSRAIAVGFAPDLVLVTDSTYGNFAWIHRAETAIPSVATFAVSTTSYKGAALTSTGFVTDLSGSGYGINQSGTTFYWTAFKFS